MGSTGEATDQDLLVAPPSTLDLLGKVGLKLALGMVTSSCSRQTACLRPACCWLG